MLNLLSDPAVLASFFTLVILEIILAVDNVLFISIAAEKLPKSQRRLARQLGLTIGMFMRIGLLFSISWVIGLTQPLATILGFEISWRDVILLGGGIFLIAKSTNEIYVELEKSSGSNARTFAGFWSVIAQIVVIDVVFSLDSVLTAVGIAEHVEIMVVSIIIAVGVMMFCAEFIARFVEAHPSTKVLALAFLIMVGFVLVADGLHYHVDRAFIYAAMLFSCSVEAINITRHRRATAADKKRKEKESQYLHHHQD